jgi:hypothetical protein
MLPGWNSLESVAAIAKLFTYLGWIALGSLVPLEVVAHLYSEREKVLSAETLRNENLVLRSDVQSLQARTKFRHLTSQQQQNVGDKIRQFPEIEYAFIVFNVGDDGDAIAEDINAALGPRGAGWKLGPQLHTSGNAPEAGIIIEVNPNAKGSVTRAANTLAEALRDEGLFVPAVRKYQGVPGTNLVLDSTWDIAISIERRP